MMAVEKAPLEALSSVETEACLLGSLMRQNDTIDSVADTQKVLIGLAGHCESFCDAKAVRCFSVNMATWRRMFIGSMPRGTGRRELKDFVIARRRELGLKPDDDNQADAIGILAHTLKMEKIDAPWAVATFDKTALGAAA